MSVETRNTGVQTMSITGIGTVTGYGWGRDRLWDGLMSGKPAATLVPGYGPDGKDDSWLARVPEGGDHADGRALSARAMAAAVREAITDAAERGWTPGRRVGFLHAVVIPEFEEWRRFYRDDDMSRDVRGFLKMMPSTIVSKLMREYDFHGPAMNVSAMCSSGNAGMITAKMWMDAGIVDDVVLVSTDVSINPEGVDHFVRLGVGVVDTEPLDACRPFQDGSRGFPAGEASIGFVLSRGTDDGYVRVLGGAMSHDGFHATSIDPRMTHVIGCVDDAFANAGVTGSDVQYFNAHGPGTAQCDAAETYLLDTMMPSARGVYSIKPLVGHCQGAAAAVEIAAAALGYERSIVPAAPRVSRGHARLLDGPTPMRPGITLKTSLGMGGHNSAIVMG